MAEDPSNLFQVGSNCRGVATAERVAVFTDGESYFRAVREALISAKSRIVIVGWDIHSEIELVRDPEPPEDGLPTQLGPLLIALLEKTPALEVCILIWDFSFIYAAEREWRIGSETWSQPHKRLHFHFDNQLPAAASHHQKLVLIDDSLAFAGGYDLSRWRWDTSGHPQFSDRRRTPAGKPYPPLHDLQVALTGPVVAELEALCEERWQRGVGHPLVAVREGASEAFPSAASLFRENLPVALSTTAARFEPYEEVRHIEQLHLDLIGQAQDWIYLENQYFTSARLGDAIASRLEEPEGPEILLILNEDTDGWLEESTMGVMRDYFLERLRSADTWGRLRVWVPIVQDDTAEEASTRVYVHAKVAITDRGPVKIGSANLTNRSMRVDTELDLTFIDPSLATELRDHLLARHLGIDPSDLAAAIEEASSLGAAVASLSEGPGRTLRPLEAGLKSSLLKAAADSAILDPEEPLDPAYWIRRRVDESHRKGVWKRVLWICGWIAAGLGLAALAKWGWGEMIDPAWITEKIEAIEGSPWTVPGLIALFLVVGLIGLPLNLFVVTTVFVVGPWLALLCGYVGSHISASLAFWIGRKVDRDRIDRLTSGRMARIEAFFEQRGALSIALIRVIPVAPFVIVNLAAGALRIRASSFHLGTLMGMLPGMLAVTLLSDQFGKMLEKPSASSVAIFIALVLAGGGAIGLVRKVLKTKQAQAQAHDNA